MKRGRPKKEITKDTVFHVRLTKEEYQILKHLSELEGKSKAEILRKALYEKLYIELEKEILYGTGKG